MVKSLRKQLPDSFFDIHMMVSAPEQWVDDMADAGADQYTFHLEATGMYTRYYPKGKSCISSTRDRVRVRVAGAD